MVAMAGRLPSGVLAICAFLFAGLALTPAMAEQAVDAKPAEVEAQQDPSSSTEPVPSRFGSLPSDEAFGAFQRGLYITAHNLAMPRAQAGDAAAQTLLAEIYSRGLGRPFDHEAARMWYGKAAAQGHPEASFRYGAILLTEGQAENDDAKLDEGRRLMEFAADKGNAFASFNLAQLVLRERPGTAGRAAAFDHFLAAAKKNVPDAQYAVAQYYAQGVAPVAIDPETAAFWLEKAARRGFDTAQLEYGQMLVSGVGVERNLEAGFGWVLQAARAGNVAARAELAKLLWGGIGTEPDSEAAASWYILAKRAGLRDRVLDDFWEGLSEDTQRKAIELANVIR